MSEGVQDSRSFCATLHSHTSIDTMLQLVGLGLADETDVTMKGLELIMKAERVYLEAYTSILLVDHAKLVSQRQRALHLNPRSS